MSRRLNLKGYLDYKYILLSNNRLLVKTLFKYSAITGKGQEDGDSALGGRKIYLQKQRITQELSLIPKTATVVLINHVQNQYYFLKHFDQSTRYLQGTKSATEQNDGSCNSCGELFDCTDNLIHLCSSGTVKF